MKRKYNLLLEELRERASYWGALAIDWEAEGDHAAADRCGARSITYVDVAELLERTIGDEVAE